VLGSTSISVNDFIELQPGDVIPLDTNINDDLQVLVGDLLKFYAKPGVKKNKVAIKISRVINREDE
jgi:flagellar motor switch protein FliM